MQPDASDLAHLWDIRQAAEAILRFTAGVRVEAFLGDDLLQSAIERQLILLGEAARRVSEGLRIGHPELPWRNMIAQRNFLVHEYGEVSPELVWRVVVDDIPALVRQISVLLQSEQPPC